MDYGNGQFERRAPLTKTITLRLKPIGETRETIREQKLLEQDAAFRKLVETVTPIVDDCIRKIADNALCHFGTEYDFSCLGNAISKNDSKAIKKETEKVEKLLAKVLTENLPDGLRKVNDINSAAFIQDTLTSFVQDDADKRVLIQELKGKTVLMQRFLTTRITALTVWLPDRVFENFNIFIENAEKMRILLDSPLNEKIMKFDPDAEQYASLEFYGQCLSQKDIDSYNLIISGIYADDEVKNPGINEIVKEYNQQIRGDKDESPLPKLKKLHKQILMPVEKAFFVRVLSNDSDARSILEKILKDTEMLPSKIIEAMKEADAGDIAVYGSRLHELSHVIYGDHGKLSQIIYDKESKRISELMETLSPKERKESKKRLEGLEEHIRKSTYTFDELNRYAEKNVMAAYIAAVEESCAEIMRKEKDLRTLLSKEDVKIRGNRHNTLIVKNYFNAWTVFRNLIRILRRKSEAEIDSDFYDVLDDSVEVLSLTYKGENLCRSYITKKIGSDLKPEIATYGSALRPNSRWWSPGEKFNVKFHTIVRRDGRLYYFILPKGAKPVELEDMDGDIECLQMRKIPNPTIFLPKLVFKDPEAFFRDNPEADEFVFLSGMKAPVTITRETYEAYRYKLYTVGKLRDGEVSEEEYKRALLQVLTAYKEFLENRMIYADLNFGFKDLEEYKDSSEFIKQVETHNTFMCWAKVSSSQLDDLVKSGNGLLFEIWSERLESYYKYGNEKVLRGYEGVLLSILKDENLVSMRTLLNSRPMLVYRPKESSKPMVVHRDGSRVVDRFDKDGKYIPPEVHDELYRFFNNLLIKEKLGEKARKILDNKKVKVKVLESERVKWSKFYDEQFAVTFSVKKNADCLDTTKDLNAEVMEQYSESNRLILIRNTTDILYYLVLDKNGKVLKQRSLNIINDGARDVDWKERFRQVTKDRNEGYNEWDYSRTSNDLKEVYLNYALKEIAEAVIEYNAILIIEKMSNAFKDKYSFLDDVTFKGFETKLLAKLSDLHFRGIKDGEPCSFTNPLQLCQNDSNKILQDGVIFMVPNSMTRSLDPDTGFIFAINDHNIRTKKAKLNFLSKFDQLKVSSEGCLIMKYSGDSLPTHNTDNRVWNCCCNHPITNYDRETKKVEFIEEPVEELSRVLEENGIETDTELNKLNERENVPGKVVDAIYSLVLNYLRGTVSGVAGQRAVYYSPVTGKKYDISFIQAMNLNRKCDYYRIGSKERGEWTDFVAQLIN